MFPIIGEVVIRTNSTGTSLTVNGPSDDVKHYGVVGDLTITAVDPDDCYYEYGFVAELVSFGTGKFVVCESAEFHQTMDAVSAIFADNENATYVEGKAPQYAQHKWDENGVCEYGHCTGGANGGRAVSDTHVHDFSNGDCLCGEPEPSLLIMNYGDLYNFAHNQGDFEGITESKLGASFDVPNTVDFIGTKQLDLNGYKLTGTTTDYGAFDKQAVLYVAVEGNLTIKDSVGTGVIEPGDGQSSTYAVYNYGNLTIKSGKYIGGSMIFEEMNVYVCIDAIAGSAGNADKTIIDGGIFINKYPNESTSSNNSVDRCTLNGGLFSHKPNLVPKETNDDSCKVKAGWTISSSKNSDGYYYLVQQ